MTKSLNEGTHRPEILVTTDYNIVLVVVEHETVGEIEFRHKAYLFDPHFFERHPAFPVTRITEDYGIPADHRCAIINNELVMVYQTLEVPDGVVCGSVWEDCATRQHLMLARFNKDTGAELFRGTITSSESPFSEDSFPDHCLVWNGYYLLVNTGSRSNMLKIREVDLNGNIHETRQIHVSNEAIPSELGNSMFFSTRKDLVVFSASILSDPTAITAAVYEQGQILTNTYRFEKDSMEQNFPTGNLFYKGYYFIAYINRPKAGGSDLNANPYYPRLKILNTSMQEIADMGIGDGSPGFSHVHPTIARIGDRILIAWSKKTANNQPQVMIEEYTAGF